MKNTIFILFLACIAAPFFAFGQATDNPELKQMFEQDQGSRLVSKIDWDKLSTDDSMRRIRVYQLIDSGKIITGQDYYHSAMIFQHGPDTTDAAMAMRHMKRAIALDSSVNKWLLAAATDRYLMYLDKPQIYGTQYTKQHEQGARWMRYKMDSTKITDAERRYYGVETLAGQREKEREMNLLPVDEFYDSKKSLERTISLIMAETKKGLSSAYSTSEESLNSFAYELMTANKNEEALKIFRLNTKLYPEGANTFDSYGECLLKMNRKAEAIRAYKRSLSLNPHNGNAENILRGIQ